MYHIVQILSKMELIWCFNNSMKFEFFLSSIYFLSFNFKRFWNWFSVLPSITMPIFMIFYPCLLDQSSEKRDKNKKSMTKMQKPLVKPSREIKQTVFIVEGRKSDYCDRWGSKSRLFPWIFMLGIWNLCYIFFVAFYFIKT